MRITIPGKPIAKKRPRFVVRGKIGHAYNDQQTEEGRFLLLAKEQIDRVFDGPLIVMIHCYMPRPKGHYGTGKNAGKLKASAPDVPTTKPDIDNCAKFVLDCLNGLAFHDDKQIIDLHVSKTYSDNPRTIITVQEFNPGKDIHQPEIVQGNAAHKV